jgi:opacity protein-like surface antigen
MNIKSLLIGSAAALAAVSGAQAADAIVAAEPEPMEYVRVCDAFGTGYFYIPGTETCLKVGGRVRYDVGAGDAYAPNSGVGTWSNTRAELYLSSASDTEYGALKTHITARWDWSPSYIARGENTRARLISAYIELGGLTVGLQDSQFSLFSGYAGDIINDDVISYGPFERDQISYTYDAGNGFKAVVALEGLGDLENDDDYVPDLVGGVGYWAGNWSANAVVGYDESVEEAAIKARIDASFGSISAFVMGGWKTDGDIVYTYGQWGGDWAVWAGVGGKLTDNLGANFQVAYDDSEVLALAANVKWNPVENLLIQPEVTYTKFGNVAGEPDQWAGMVRFQRSF